MHHMIGASRGPWGVSYDETAEAYHASGAIGSSALNDFIRSEELFRGRYIDGRWPREKTRQMSIGSALHAFRLEGAAAFRSRFAVRPDDLDGRTTAGKTWAAANAGREILTADDGRLVRTMALAIRQNPEARRLLRTGRPEVTVRYDTMRWGIPIQARLDWLTGEDPRWPEDILDLKTTDDVDTWPRDVYSFGYHRQAELYSWITCAVLDLPYRPRFTFVVVEKKPPHRVSLFRLTEDFHELAWQEVDEALSRLADRLNNGGWRRDADGVQPVDIPRWKRIEMEQVA